MGYLSHLGCNTVKFDNSDPSLNYCPICKKEILENDDIEIFYVYDGELRFNLHYDCYYKHINLFTKDEKLRYKRDEINSKLQKLDKKIVDGLFNGFITKGELRCQ